MHCAGCGGEQFQLDDVSGRYVCTLCWQVSEFYVGLTQDFDPNKRGLRRLCTKVPASQQDPFATSQLAGTSLSVPTLHTELDPQPDDLKRPGSPTYGPDVSVLPPDRRSKKQKLSKEDNTAHSRNLRAWRVSEAFSLLLRIQLKELIQAYVNESHAPDLVQTVWRFWTNYLAITGELGGNMWALSFRQVANAVKALVKSRGAHFQLATKWRSGRLSYLPKVTLNMRASKPVIEPSIHDEATAWSVATLHLKHFQWVGWGQLYNPRASAGLNNYLLAHEHGLMDENADEEEWNANLEPSDREYANRFKKLCTSSTNSELLRELWEESVISSIALRKTPGAVFWRGQLSDGRRRFLPEYNLALLFISCLISFSGPFSDGNPDLIRPSCKPGVITLQDIQELCKNKNFAYTTADKFVAEAFTCYDSLVLSSYRRQSPPQMSILVKTAVTIMHMLGIRHRPKVRLQFLVHRYLVLLGFPFAAHRIADRLLKLVGRCVQHSIDFLGACGLHYWLPLNRYVRFEVFAMAIVVILARMLFKLNDDYEYRWSQVAEYLNCHSEYARALAEIVRTSGDASTELTEGVAEDTSNELQAFVWTRWACWLDKLAESRDIAVSKDLRSKQMEWVNSATSFSQLHSVQHVSDFLGAAEFSTGKNVSWGEFREKQRQCARRSFKDGLIEPLRKVAYEGNLSAHTKEKAVDTIPGPTSMKEQHNCSPLQGRISSEAIADPQSKECESRIVNTDDMQMMAIAEQGVTNCDLNSTKVHASRCIEDGELPNAFSDFSVFPMKQEMGPDNNSQLRSLTGQETDLQQQRTADANDVDPSHSLGEVSQSFDVFQDLGSQKSEFTCNSQKTVANAGNSSQTSQKEVEIDKEEDRDQHQCSSCFRFSKGSGARRAGSWDDISEFGHYSLDCTVGAHRIMRKQGLSSMELFTLLPTSQIRVQKDWCHVLDCFRKYQPICFYDLTASLNPRGVLSMERLPDPTHQFVRRHAQRLFDFLTGESRRPDDELEFIMAGNREATEELEQQGTCHADNVCVDEFEPTATPSKPKRTSKSRKVSILAIDGNDPGANNSPSQANTIFKGTSACHSEAEEDAFMANRTPSRTRLARGGCGKSSSNLLAEKTGTIRTPSVTKVTQQCTRASDFTPGDEESEATETNSKSMGDKKRGSATSCTEAIETPLQVRKVQQCRRKSRLTSSVEESAFTETSLTTKIAPKRRNLRNEKGDNTSKRLRRSVSEGEITSPEAEKTSKTSLKTPSASLMWFLRAASSLCASTTQELVREVVSIEHILLESSSFSMFQSPADGKIRMRDFAMVSAFDYSVD